jgi:hypothetical protein
MKGREIPPVVGWIVGAVVLVAAGYFIWSATGPSTVTGGKPNARDQELLRGMQASRESAGMGRTGPSSTTPTKAPEKTTSP